MQGQAHVPRVLSAMAIMPTIYHFCCLFPHFLVLIPLHMRGMTMGPCLGPGNHRHLFPASQPRVGLYEPPPTAVRSFPGECQEQHESTCIFTGA